MTLSYRGKWKGVESRLAIGPDASNCLKSLMRLVRLVRVPDGDWWEGGTEARSRGTLDGTRCTL